MFVRLRPNSFCALTSTVARIKCFSQSFFVKCKGCMYPCACIRRIQCILLTIYIIIIASIRTRVMTYHIFKNVYVYSLVLCTYTYTCALVRRRAHIHIHMYVTASVSQASRPPIVIPFFKSVDCSAHARLYH